MFENGLRKITPLINEAASVQLVRSVESIATTIIIVYLVVSQSK